MSEQFCILIILNGYQKTSKKKVEIKIISRGLLYLPANVISKPFNMIVIFIFMYSSDTHLYDY